MDESQLDESHRRGGQFLVVFGQPPKEAESAEGTLNLPSPLLGHETLLGLLGDVDLPLVPLGHGLAGLAPIGLVGADELHPARASPQLPEQVEAGRLSVVAEDMLSASGRPRLSTAVMLAPGARAPCPPAGL